MKFLSFRLTDYLFNEVINWRAAESSQTSQLNTFSNPFFGQNVVTSENSHNQTSSAKRVKF